MKANKTMLKMMVLVALSTIAFLSLATAAFAAQPPAGALETAKPYELDATKLEIASPAKPEFEYRAIQDSALEVIGAAEPVEEHVAQPDEFEDLPAGSEGDVGDVPDATDEKLVPVHQTEQPSTEPTNPPILVRVTEQSHDDTPTYIPSRDHLAFTGGPQVAYLLAGALIIALAAGMFFLGRKQAQQ